MTPSEILALIQLMEASALSTLRDKMSAQGDTNPCGDGDLKTAVPGTYRPVGLTCPTGQNGETGRCRYLQNGCYAESGNVNTHQRRASHETDASLRAAILAMVWAVRTGRVARLHVSGDFLRPDGSIDVAYLDGLQTIGRILCDRHGPSVYAWTYTHIPRAVFAHHAVALYRAGIAVRFSDDEGHSGAVVRSFSDRAYLDGLKARGIPYAKCPAQLTDTDCARCGICYVRPALLVIFDPHGSRKRAVLAALAALPPAPPMPVRPSLRVVA